MIQRATRLFHDCCRRVRRRGRLVAALVLVSTLTIVAPDATIGLESEGKLVCNQGPITETIGGSEWKVYGCLDCCSLIFFATEGSPAFPYYFILTPENGDYKLYSEGAGDSVAVDAAQIEIESYDAQEIRALIQKTKKGM